MWTTSTCKAIVTGNELEQVNILLSVTARVVKYRGWQDRGIIREGSPAPKWPCWLASALLGIKRRARIR